MKQGKHMIETPQRSAKRSGGKRLTLIVAFALLLTLSVGLTAAFIVDETEEVPNTFTPAHVTCEVTETVTGGVKSSVKITNTSNIDAYLRAVVVGNTVDEDGNVTGTFDVSGYLCGPGWVKGNDGYFYWTAVVAPEGLTGELLTGSINLNEKQVTILAEAIQSEPARARTAADWGWSPSTD